MGIGQLVKQHRERLKWSQPQLARKSGVSTSAIWRIENGERLGRGDTIARLVKVLGIDPADAQAALEEDGYQFPIQPPPEEPSVEELLERTRMQFEKVRPLSIPLIEQRAAAGYITGVIADTEHIYYLPEQENQRKHRLLAIRVSGDCLEPRVMDGHTVIVDRDGTAKEGDIVLAIHDGEALLKEFRIIEGRSYLVALQGQEPIPASHETKIEGVVIEAKYRP